MKVLKRSEVIILESNLIDEEPIFNKALQYKKDDVVQDGKAKYKAKADVINQDLNNLTYWEKIGVVNYYACFDYYLNTIARAKDCIDITFSCFGSSGIYITGLKAKRLLIEVIDVRANKVIEQKEFNLSSSLAAKWSEYFFGSWKDKQVSNIYYERKTLTRYIAFRVKAYGLKDIEISSIICGAVIDIAMTLYAKNSISMLDFSKIETDEAGYTLLTKGNFKRTNTFEMIVNDSDMNRVSYLLEELRGEAAVFIIALHFENLINFGFLKNHEILLEKPGKSIVSIEIEGLI